MTTSGWQRRELRRALPPAVRQRNIKVLNHLGIAGMIASRQTRRGPEERDDLEQEARIGLIRGWERFDPVLIDHVAKEVDLADAKLTLFRFDDQSVVLEAVE